MSQQKSPFFRMHQRMNDRFKNFEAFGILHKSRTQLAAINPAFRRRTGKCSFDGRNRLAFMVIELMNNCICAAHRHAKISKSTGNCRFPHSDRARQPHDKHMKSYVFSTISARDHASALDRTQIAQFLKQGIQRQTQNREIVTFDALDQVNAKSFKLVAPNTAQYAITDARHILPAILILSI